MSDFPACDASLQAAHNAGDPWNYCSTVHCDDISSYNHQFCYCQGQFNRPPYIVNGQCINGVGSLIPIANPGCYCCCSCFAYDTPIAVTANTTKAVQEFVINDPVWVAEGADLKTWVQKPVAFSSGTGSHGQNRLIKIHYGTQTTGITVTPYTFAGQYVTPDQSQTYFTILSTAPNNYIGSDGLVNLQLAINATVDALSRLLACTMVVAQRILDILRIDSNYLLVTGNQPFLMNDKTIKQAQKLIPGKDVLVKADGSTTPIISLEVGMFEKGVHHIATSNKPATSLGGHLMLANGIVVGDFSLQLGLSGGATASVKDVYAQAPIFGTREYNEANKQLVTTPFGAYAGSKVTQSVDSFTAHQVDNATPIPDGAFSFVTDDQAEELFYTAPIFPASKSVAEPDVRYLFRLFGAFYPDTTFYYDQNNMLPNVYSFEQYGKKVVVVTIGWTLLEGIYFQGIAMAISHVVNALYQGKLPPGISPVGDADYYIYPAFLSLFYRAPDAVKNYNLALDQVKTEFVYIKKTRNPEDSIGIDCRIATLEASINGLALPHCAGGPPDPALEVTDVTAVLPENAKAPVITISFNLAVDPATATSIGNYLLDPAAIAYSAAIDPTDNQKVNLVADIEAGLEYYLVATGVLSTAQQPLVPGKNGAKFTLKA